MFFRYYKNAVKNWLSEKEEVEKQLAKAREVYEYQKKSKNYEEFRLEENRHRLGILKYAIFVEVKKHMLNKTIKRMQKPADTINELPTSNIYNMISFRCFEPKQKY